MASITRKDSVANPKSHFLLLALLAFCFILFSLWKPDSNFDANTSTFALLSSSASSTSVPVASEETSTSTGVASPRHRWSLPREILQKVKYQPLHCPRFLSNTTITANDPNKLERVHRQTTTPSPFWISVHKKEFDGIRWDIIEYGRYYERELESIWAHIMTTSTASPDGGAARVLDIGGNIGFYSLYSASFGPMVVVDAFEPNYKNNLRFCESVLLNDWPSEFDDYNEATAALGGNAVAGRGTFPRAVSRSSGTSGGMVNIYPYGVSSHSGVLTFQENINPGGGTFAKNNFAGGLAITQQIEVLTLDDFCRERGWFETTATTQPNIAILKIDVEGHAAEVLLGAKELLKQRLVKNIFSEIHYDDDEQNQRASFDLLIQNGYQLVGQGSFRGPGQVNRWISDATLIGKVLEAVNKGKGLPQFVGYLNLWWSLDGATRPEHVTFK